MYRKSKPQEIYKWKLTPFPLNAVPLIILVAKVMPSTTIYQDFLVINRLKQSRFSGDWFKMQSVFLLIWGEFVFYDYNLWELIFAVVKDSSGFSCWVLIFATLEKS